MEGFSTWGEITLQFNSFKAWTVINLLMVTFNPTKFLHGANFLPKRTLKLTGWGKTTLLVPGGFGTKFLSFTKPEEEVLIDWLP